LLLRSTSPTLGDNDDGNRGSGRFSMQLVSQTHPTRMAPVANDM